MDSKTKEMNGDNLAARRQAQRTRDDIMQPYWSNEQHGLSIYCGSYLR